MPALVVTVPLLAALALPLISRLWRGAGPVVVVASLGFAFYGSLTLLFETANGPIRYAMGAWVAPIGIEYVVDRLNAMILTMVSGAGFLAAIWMRRSVAKEIIERGHGAYYAVFLLFATGLLGITITGDVFNLYVFLEIASITSYVLIAMGRKRQALYAGFSYLILGSLGATFILLGIGHLYMATGTLAMADLAVKLPELYDSSTVRTAYAFFTIGLAIKMALFPLHAWQPAAYTHAPSGASVFLAATATKVSAYVFYRITFTVFGGEFVDVALPVVQDGVLIMCVGAIVVGPLIAVKQNNLKRLLAYSSVGQIGYIMLGVVLFTWSDKTEIDGLTGGIIHFWNHAAAKGALFCVAGGLVFRTGAARVQDLAGMGRTAPWTSAVLTVACCSMIGVPLTAGFLSKFYLASGALEADRGYVVVVLLISSLLTAVYSWRLLQLVWFAPKDADPKVREDVPWSMRLPAIVLGAACLIFGVYTAHIDIAVEAAEGLLK